MFINVIKSSLPRQFAGGEGVLICLFKETLRYL